MENHRWEMKELMNECEYVGEEMKKTLLPGLSLWALAWRWWHFKRLVWGIRIGGSEVFSCCFGYQWTLRTNDRMLLPYDNLDLYVVLLIIFGWTLSKAGSQVS